MNFNSLEFLIFLPLVLLGYWLLPHRYRWILLLIASYVFYMWWNPWLVGLIATTTLVSYAAALGLERYPKHRKRLLVLTLVVCLGILFYFKYFEFLANSVLTLWEGITGNHVRLTLDLLLPVGISFYTFQTLSYVIDVYRGEFPAERHLGYYALFVSYFPQLVAGPIESAGNLLPQLRAEHTPCWEDFRMGGQILLCGFFRKCVVADFCGIYVNQLFSNAEHANSLAIAFGGALFCIQMYCDFAGYSEIATGAARMMGIRLMRNFDRPYLSASYSEFFRRWHISLNHWFTSYLYIPLGGSRRGKLRRLLNSTIVFLLCGLWHGASWTYVLWGLYAAIFVGFEGFTLKPVTKALAAKGIDLESPGIRLGRQWLMFLIFLPAALLFRAESLEQVGVIFSGLFTRWGFGLDYLNAAFDGLGMDGSGLLQIGLSILCMCRIYPLTLEPAGEGAHERCHQLNAYLYLILTVALCWLALLATQDNAAFAYFQF